MLRDQLLYALYEEITANYTLLSAAMDYVYGLTYLTLDESDALVEILTDWYGD